MISYKVTHITLHLSLRHDFEIILSIVKICWYSFEIFLSVVTFSFLGNQVIFDTFFWYDEIVHVMLKPVVKSERILHVF